MILHMNYKSIFVSDIHLGTKFSQADKFLDFMKENESENLYLVGDIIDGWAMKRKYRWAQSHSDVVQKILRKARKGTNVYYITGNHDEFLRSFLPILLGDNLHVLNEADYTSVDGKKYYVIHGDFFDSVTMTKKWLAILGDIGYDLLLNVNQIFQFFRKLFRINRYWSLSIRFGSLASIWYTSALTTSTRCSTKSLCRHSNSCGICRDKIAAGFAAVTLAPAFTRTACRQVSQ